MTNAEALQEVVQIEFSDNAFEKVFSESDLNGEDDYAKENEEAIDKLAIKLLSGPLPKRITEGGYTIDYGTAAKETVAFLTAKWTPVVSNEPSVEDISNQW